MDDIGGEKKLDLSSLVLKKKKKINRQSNITLEEDQLSLSSVVSPSNPVISIFFGKFGSDELNKMSSNSLTLSKYSKDINNFKRINSQKSVQEPNMLSISNNIIDDSVSRKSSFNSVRYIYCYKRL